MVDRRALELFGPASLERATYLQMCEEAAWGPREKWAQGSVVTLTKGQLIYGRKAWAAKMGVTEGEMRGIVARLETGLLINHTSTGKNGVITVCYIASEPDTNRKFTADQPEEAHISNKEQRRRVLIKILSLTLRKRLGRRSISLP